MRDVALLLAMLLGSNENDQKAGVIDYILAKYTLLLWIVQIIKLN